MTTPSDALAKRIIDRLTKEQLLSAADGQRLAAKLADGSARAEDWRLAIELAADKRRGEAEGGAT